MRINGLEEQIHIVDDKVTVEEIIKDVVRIKKLFDPFCIFDVGHLLNQVKQWQQMFPRVKPYYAVKYNANALLLEILAAVGVNFDCASRDEMKQILNLGVNPSHIIFNSLSNIPTHINYAMKKSVNLLTFDKGIELYKIKAIHPTCNLVIRICCMPSETQCPLDIKSGCNPYTQAPGLLSLARSLDLNVVGVSFSIGSRCNEPVIFQRAISTSSIIFDLAKKLGFMNMYLLNIGGGFFGISLDIIAGIVNEALNEFFPLEKNVTIIAEPSRFLAASAFTIATQINSIKNCPNDHVMYFIKDKTCGSFNNILYDDLSIMPIPLKNYSPSPVYQSSIWGPISNGLDKVIDLVNLPLMEINDWIIFGDMGVYSIPTIGIRTLPKVFSVVNRGIWHTLKNMMPISEEHFTTVPIVAIVKMIQTSNNDDNWNEHNNTSNEDDDILDADDMEWPDYI